MPEARRMTRKAREAAATARQERVAATARGLSAGAEEQHAETAGHTMCGGAAPPDPLEG